jgi:glycosyltransferase involved in cell wall biosynthesis/GT2 family glycosyltransferase
LRDRETPVELILAGGGDAVYAQQLKQLAKALGLEDRVRFAGFLDDPYPTMAECSVILVCSRREAFGRTGAEAMLMAKPLVYSASGGVAEYVENGVTGLSYPPGDVKALADRISSLWHDPGLGIRLGQAAEAFARATFTHENSEGKFYQRALALRSASTCKANVPRALLPAIQRAMEAQGGEAAKMQEELVTGRGALAAVQAKVDVQRDWIGTLNTELSTARERLVAMQSQARMQRRKNARLQRELTAAREQARMLRDKHESELRAERAGWERQSESASQTVREEMRALQEAHAAELAKERNPREEHVRELARLKRINNGAKLPPELRNLRHLVLPSRKWRRLVADYRAIAGSPLFNAEWYLAHNPDVAAAKVDPALHYLRHGGKEGRAPGPHFDGKGYLQVNCDVAAAGMNPLLHYVRHGSGEGRRLRIDLRLRQDRIPSASRPHLPPQGWPLINGNAESHVPASIRARRQKGKLNILFFSPFPSHPPTHGNQANIEQFCRRFQALGHKVHFALLRSNFYDAAAEQAMRNAWDTFDILHNTHPLGADGREIPFDGWYQHGLGEEIRLICAKYDVDVVFCSYIFQSKLLEYVPSYILKVIDTHDKMGGRYDMLRANGQPLEFFSCTPEEEGAYLRRADVVVARRAEEARYFNSVTGRESAIVVPYFEPPHFIHKKFNRLANVGLLASANRINLTIVRAFLEAVARHCGTACPFTVHIAGQVKDMAKGIPEIEASAFRVPWVRLHGFVPEIGSFYRQMDAVASPVTMGTGINVKTVQAMAFGMPLVTTRWGCKGIETNEPMHNFADVDSLVAGLLSLHKNPEELNLLAQVSRDRYTTFYKEASASISTLFQHEKLAGSLTDSKSTHAAEALAPKPYDLREAFLAWYGKTAIYFPPVADPTVSIIIPVYGNLDHLETCLRSLAAHRSTEPPFEVVVVDDCPAEPVNWALPQSGGLIKISNSENLGFLLSCNRGAKAARGRFLCFLNSDTIVSPRWLTALVEALEETPDAALAGCMLLNVDGTIQDAGWRILSNGQGCPIGRDADATDGAYTYRRETDCVTGACFLTRASLFTEMGGMDTLYIPAFYEEFDYAFRARLLGLKTIYEPGSRVMHLGSASYGDEKRIHLSRVNQQKFAKRFASILTTQPHDPGDDFEMRHGSSTRPVIFVVDQEVPQPDRHAGDVMMSKYLSLLAEARWRVVFAPMNEQASGPPAETLERQGIELIRAPSTIESWIRQNGRHVQEVLLARPEIAEVLIRLMRQHTTADLSYFTHDLHHLRLQREAEAHGNKARYDEARRVKKQECAVFEAVDRILSPSQDEADIISSLAPGKQVEVLPLHYYDEANLQARDRSHFERCTDVLFVGGFPHRPNVDAALFIVNGIMPLVWAKWPQTRIILAGYGPPPEVRDLANERVIVTGQVPSLAPYYDRARLVLAALRYGAGVKGKVLEALSLGIPVVSTPIGAEGIGITPGTEAIVARDTADLAAAVLGLLADAARCAELSNAGIALIRKRFSRLAALNAISRVFRNGL